MVILEWCSLTRRLHNGMLLTPYRQSFLKGRNLLSVYFPADCFGGRKESNFPTCCGWAMHRRGRGSKSFDNHSYYGLVFLSFGLIRRENFSVRRSNLGNRQMLIDEGSSQQLGTVGPLCQRGRIHIERREGIGCVCFPGTGDIPGLFCPSSHRTYGTYGGGRGDVNVGQVLLQQQRLCPLRRTRSGR